MCISYDFMHSLYLIDRRTIPKQKQQQQQQHQQQTTIKEQPTSVITQTETQMSF